MSADQTAESDAVRRGGVLSKIHPGLLYTGGRILVFAVVLGLLYVVGFRSWLLVFAAMLLSIPLSYFVLARVRMSFAARVEGRVSQRQAEKAKLRAALAGDDDTV